MHASTTPLCTRVRLGPLSAVEWLLVALGLALIVAGLPALAPLA